MDGRLRVIENNKVIVAGEGETKGWSSEAVRRWVNHAGGGRDIKQDREEPHRWRMGMDS